MGVADIQAQLVEYLNSIFRRNRNQDPNRNNGRGQNLQSSQPRFDGFFRSGSRVPTLNDLPQVNGTGGLEGVKNILQIVRGAFGSSASNASPIFRFGLADWAIGLLTNAAAEIQSIIAGSAVKSGDPSNPLTAIATTLKGVIDSLIGFVKGFTALWTDVIKGLKQLAKMFQDVGKSAG